MFYWNLEHILCQYQLWKITQVCFYTMETETSLYMDLGDSFRCILIFLHMVITMSGLIQYRSRMRAKYQQSMGASRLKKWITPQSDQPRPHTILTKDGEILNSCRGVRRALSWWLLLKTLLHSIYLIFCFHICTHKGLISQS